MPMIRKLYIRCAEVSDDDALVHFCATGTNLEYVGLHVLKYYYKQLLLCAVATLRRIINAIRSNAKLKAIKDIGNVETIEIHAELREAVQCMRARRVLLTCGTFILLYEKLVY